jgi:hypothetical protein
VDFIKTSLYTGIKSEISQIIQFSISPFYADSMLHMKEKILAQIFEEQLSDLGFFCYHADLHESEFESAYNCREKLHLY